MGKIKVLHLVEALGGGIYSYFVDLSHYFGDRQDIKTYIAFSDKRNEIIPDKIAQDINENIELIKIPIKKSISPILDSVAIYRFYKIIKSVEPDIIHLHSSKAGVIGRLSYILYANSRVKLYYTPHGYAFLRKDISKFQRKMYWLIEYSMKKLSGGTTIACGDTELEYSNKFGKSILVRNGVNLPNITKHLESFSNRTLTVGILGRITFARNPKMFNEIAERLKELNFIWIGDGELNSTIDADNIEVTGWFPNREVGLRYLNNIDIYLQTSLWEGLPISLIEAMTLKKPIVATNIIGNKDVVEHGVNGFLFDTVDDCVHYINQLKDQKLRASFGENGRLIADKKFDFEKNLEQLSLIYLS
ncbi:glycosyltransferase [Winogradskyella sp.]|uniref:glycosyltransferase n=1 Tax=Winogradskyella sp. TaxID=1883156 RepID=UPI003BAD29C4